MLGDGGTGDVEVLGDLSGGELVFGDQLEDVATIGLGNRFENSLHGIMLAIAYERVN
jgi:hypothetical protein